ncbi:MAG: 6-pyruvoyl-tetrahydropterin synthase-related protein [Deltaproteobacteria bacterium]
MAFVPATASAGTISFKITTTVETSAGIKVVLDVTNTGNEAAYSLVPRLVYSSHLLNGARLAKLDPGGSYSWNLTILEETPPPGAYALVVRLGYTDANTYPFEALSAIPFDVGTLRKRPVTGRLQAPTLKGNDKVEAKLSLAVPAGRGEHFAVRLIVPRGLTAKPLRQEFTLGADRHAVLPLSLGNSGLLPNTRVALLALVESRDQGSPQTDVVQGIITIGQPTPTLSTQGLIKLLAVLVVTLIMLELLGGSMGQSSAIGWAEALLIAVPSAFLAYHYPWDALLAPTTVAGGDMASLFYPTRLLADEILGRGELTGWTMGNYSGFPVFHFYSTLPFVVIALVGQFLPMEQTFKIVSLAGPTLLPLAAAYLLRSLRYSRGAAVLAAISTVPFLFQQGNSMWGGNIPSVLAGEFCHAIGLTLSLVFAGSLHRAAQGRQSWTLSALLLAAVGLSHTYAFMAAVWYALFFLWPRKDMDKKVSTVIPVFLLAFLLLCFWGVPVPARLQFTTEWSMIWKIKAWTEVLPVVMWPAAALALANLLLMATSLKPFDNERQGFLIFALAGGVFLYFLVPAIGFPDIRFIPVAQIFLGLLAADLLAWAGGRLGYPLLFTACVLTAGLAWSQQHLGYIPSWLNWNYTGYEQKTPWPTFKAINDHLRGDLNDPRVVFEHSQMHNRFGSSRAFENLPFFSGRATLEGVFHQASLNSPFIFYLQSETSERGSGPFPQYTYTRLNPKNALPHLKLFNVGNIIAVSEKAKAAYDQHPDFERTFSSGPYAVYTVHGGDSGYVTAATHQPVLYEGPDWKVAFFRWFKHPELIDVPLVPADLLKTPEARRFVWRTDSVTRIPRVPLEGDCNVSSNIEQYSVSFDTDCPGRPHIVKVSYFPRWKTADGSPLFPVSPGFMLVYPKGHHVEIVYARRAIDYLALALTIAGLALLLACLGSPPLSRRLTQLCSRTLDPVRRFVEDRARNAALLLIIVAVASATATRVSLRNPDRDYDEARTAYRDRDFDTAIERFEAWVATDRETFKQASALYQLGVSYSDVDNPAASVVTHERLLFEFPNINYGAGTLFHLARNYARLGMRDKARQKYGELAFEHPDSPLLKRLEREVPGLAATSPQG